MKKIQTLLFLLLLSLNLPLYSQCSGHPDYEPLMAFYNATNGPNWIVNYGWEEGAAGTNCNPCNNWHGVVCANNRVILLFPTDNNISGNIPSEISELTELTGLILQRNNLTGNIPFSLGSLSKLKILSLDDNNLTGTIPSSLGNLINLEDFGLSNNNLSGCIPDSLQILCPNIMDDFALGGNENLSTTSWENFCENQEGMCSTTSTYSKYQVSTIAFPNPTTDFIKLKNNSGKKIINTKFINHYSLTYSAFLEKENCINISHLPGGVYFLHVLFEDDSLEIVRIIKI